MTLLNPLPADATDSGVRSIDGSTFDPFTGQLLFTAEAGNLGGVFGQPLKWSSTAAPPVVNYDGSMGKAGYEGIHNDKLGNLIIVEDTGGGNVTPSGSSSRTRSCTASCRTHAGDLTKGKLQVLQISVNGTPVVFHSTATDGAAAALDDAMGENILAIHSGQSQQAKWVTIHDTAVDGTAPFDANAAAKAGGVGARARR